MFMFVKSLLENPPHTSYEGEDKDEVILYVLRQSFWRNVGWITGSILLVFVPFIVLPLLPSFIDPALKLTIVMFWYLVLFGYTFQRFINWFFNVYIISNKKIIDVDFHGILYKNISEAALTSVEDVTSVVKGAMGVTFNIGDVLIQTAGESREFDFEGVDNPSKVRDIISDLVTKRKGLKK
jgi:hypothetical protein